ncbi:viral integrase family 1 [Salmonella phage 18-India]|nr:viral integrase family 1 [Salmonella phage 18-India]
MWSDAQNTFLQGASERAGYTSCDDSIIIVAPKPALRLW